MSGKAENWFYAAFIAILFSGCCFTQNCGEGFYLSFKIIDKTSGKDLISDLGVPLSDIHLLAASGDTLEILEGENSGGKFLSIHLHEANSFFTINYNQEEYKITYQTQLSNARCCPALIPITLASSTALVEEDTTIPLSKDEHQYKIKIT